MKSKISLFSKAVFKRNLTGGWCLWAGLLVFYLLVLPVNVYSSMSETIKYSSGSDGALPALLQYTMMSRLWGMKFFVPFFAAAALFCAMFVFSYLFTGRNSNMMHTFPLNRVSLFVTNYVTGLVFLLVPAILAALLTLAVTAACGAANGEMAKYVFLWIVVVAVENMFFFSMAVCVLMFVGNIVAVPVLYLILNCLYEGCIITAETMLTTVCYGLDSISLFGNEVGVLTPVVYLRRAGAESYFDGENVAVQFNRMNTLPGYFAAAILFMLIALAAYQKKHIETAGDVITVKWLKPIFRWGAAVCTSAVGALFFSNVFYAKSFAAILSCVVVIGILVFFFAQMLLERSVRIFTKRKIRECIIYTVIVSACYIALDLDVAGLEKKMPSADEIEAVQIHGSISLLAVDEEEISWALNIHSQVISSRKEFKRIAQNGRQETEYLIIQYLLNDGSIFERSYVIPVSDADGSVSKQVQEQACRPEVGLKQLFGIHYPEVDIYGGSWVLYTDGRYDVESRVSETDAKQLYEAVVSDINSGRLDGDMNGSSQEAQTAERIGDLTLDVRDEAGFYTSASYSDSIYKYHAGNAEKDGKAFIYVDERFTSLIEKMHELGYLSNERYERISRRYGYCSRVRNAH